mgnify:FL=1
MRLFQASHEGDLPTQQASNLQILSGLQAQLQNEQDALNTAHKKRFYFGSLIEASRTSPRVLNDDGTSAQVSPIQLINRDLATLRAKLEVLNSRYTDRYPDVLALKDQIARTERMRDKLLADAQRTSNDGNLSGNSMARAGNTPENATM